jgi:hypothetical protein
MAFLFSFAVWTGLEPATLGVTGRYSNQLNYHTIIYCAAKISEFLFMQNKFLKNITCQETKVSAVLACSPQRGP